MMVFAGTFELSNPFWGLEWSMWTAPLAPCCSRSIFQEYPVQAKGVPPTAWPLLSAALVAFGAGPKLVPVGTFQLQTVMICSRWCV